MGQLVITKECSKHGPYIAFVNVSKKKSFTEPKCPKCPENVKDEK